MKKGFLFFSILFFLTMPLFSYAQTGTEWKGLVPCGNPGQNPCDLCYLISGTQGIINWGLKIMTIVAIVAIFIAGIIYLISAGDENMMTASKSFMKSVIIGVIVYLAGWLIISTTFKILNVDGEDLGVGKKWYDFSVDCQYTQYK